MKGLVMLMALALAGCSLVAPFNPEDQPIRLGSDGGPDGDSDGDFIDFDFDGSVDAGSECVPDCQGRPCGPDGCGGSCSPGCGPGQVCAACPPSLECDEPYDCVDPGADLWVLVAAGQFYMGSPPEEPGHEPGEPRRRITLTHDFVIFSSEATQALLVGSLARSFSYFSEEGDGTPCGPSCPAEMVTWHEAALFCNMLSGNDQLPECYACDGQVCQPSDEYATPSDCPGYRLPTEAEWEYAARATTSDATYRGDIASGDLECAETNPVLDGIAWYCGNSSGSTHQVASGEANVWGLYDMLGNVSEWCQDWFTDTPDELTTDPWGPPNGAQRVIRGGAWSDDARDQRAASRRGLVPSRRDFVGVRPVRSVSFSAISLE